MCMKKFDAEKIFFDKRVFYTPRKLCFVCVCGVCVFGGGGGGVYCFHVWMSVRPWYFVFPQYLEKAMMEIHQNLQTRWYW